MKSTHQGAGGQKGACDFAADGTGVLRWRNRQPLQRGRFNLPADRAGDRRQLALPDLRDHQNRDARRFNGTLVVEWANVALGLECGFVFNEAHEYLRPDATDQFQRGTGTLIHGLPVRRVRSAAYHAKHPGDVRGGLHGDPVCCERPARVSGSSDCL